MNLITLLAKINKKADEDHTHKSTEIEGLGGIELVPIEKTEIDGIVDNALKN